MKYYDDFIKHYNISDKELENINRELEYMDK